MDSTDAPSARQIEIVSDGEKRQRVRTHADVLRVGIFPSPVGVVNT